MAFTGKATYSAFAAEVQVDLAPLVELLAPVETPVLDYVGDAEFPARSVEHKWLQEEYAPGGILTALIASTAINSATAATAVQVNGWAGAVQVGDVFQLGTRDETNGAEHLQVSSIVGGGGSASANSIVFTRGAFGTSQRSSTAGQSLIPIASSSFEGGDQNPDISTVRVSRSAYVQIIRKPVEVSLTQEAVDLYGGIGSEYNHQMTTRMRQALRDLENAVLRGTSTETIGSGSVYRTMKGLYNWITVTHTVSQNLFSTDTIDNAVEASWLLGHRPLQPGRAPRLQRR